MNYQRPLSTKLVAEYSRHSSWQNLSFKKVNILTCHNIAKILRIQYLRRPLSFLSNEGSTIFIAWAVPEIFCDLWHKVRNLFCGVVRFSFLISFWPYVLFRIILPDVFDILVLYSHAGQPVLVWRTKVRFGELPFFAFSRRRIVFTKIHQYCAYLILSS